MAVNRVMLLFLVLLMCYQVQPRRIEKRALPAASNLLTIGDSVGQALNLWDELSDRLLAKIYIEVSDYTKWPLSAPQDRMSRGEILLAPTLVEPGHEEAWAAKQSLDLGFGVEGISAWTTSSGRFCYFYFSVNQNVPLRDPNALAVGCRSSNFVDLEDVARAIREVKSSPQSKTDEMVYQEYDDNHPTILFCDEDLCIQGKMTSGYDCKASVDFIPRRVENLAPNFKGTLTQDQLDDITAEENDCKLGCDGASSQEVGLQMMSLLLLCLGLW